MSTATSTSDSHPVVSPERWLAERRRLLAREKELTRLGDELARERRALPWRRVDKRYLFDTPEGERGLDQLFDGRRQLLVQHFMFAPGWEQGCKSCSFMADHIDGARAHLAQRDLSFLAVSRAPLAEIERFRQRMGWRFRWVSSQHSDFNYDFGVSFTPQQRAEGAVPYNYVRQPFPHEEAPGLSVFYREADGSVFHCYSSYGRGVEVMMGTYPLLDLAPKGRDEQALAYSMEWVRHHDRYDAPASTPAAGGCCAAQR
ncbi:DUF899 domain-containing protein [Roseateles violae]|uniref:DUF899 domain-containing protein n=1 Tax=Roseateles violae TaxID=3058042 RepID=A0ABT8DYT0_9BURK|nr:DUF899 domain-containing protein [Pelomonas sp. PFR6]MDN3922743.1 DUF899 domain-containing protein [Pelomonas sp. PFR6]